MLDLTTRVPQAAATPTATDPALERALLLAHWESEEYAVTVPAARPKAAYA